MEVIIYGGQTEMSKISRVCGGGWEGQGRESMQRCIIKLAPPTGNCDWVPLESSEEP